MRKLSLLLVCAALPLACISGPDSADNEQVINRGAGKDQWWDALPREAWSEFARVEQSQD